jgi:DNA-binding transcriptional ArsR family regulator
MNTLHDDLDHVWRALANLNRRRMLDLLRDRPMTTGELAEALGENRFVVMQHLALLRAASLVTVIAEGRRRINFLNPIPIQHIYERWVGKYQGDWASALVGLKRTVERQTESRTTSKRRRSNG